MRTSPIACMKRTSPSSVLWTPCTLRQLFLGSPRYERSLDIPEQAESHSQLAYAPSIPPIGLVNVNSTRDWHQEDMAMHMPSRLYTRTNTMTNSLVPSIAPSIPRMPAVGSYEEQGASQVHYQESQRTGMRHDVVPVSSRPSRPSRPPLAAASGITTHRAPMGRYPCNLCGKRYFQPQGLKRHQRESHGASRCMYCRGFKWGRPYLLRDHLKKRHPEVNIDAALEEATRTHRRATADASQAIVETE